MGVVLLESFVVGVSLQAHRLTVILGGMS